MSGKRTYTETLAAVETRLEDLSHQTERLTNTILGNGREGVVERLTRNEENLETAISALKDLTVIVQTHVANNDKHNGGLNKKTAGFLVALTGGFFEIIHQLIGLIK